MYLSVKKGQKKEESSSFDLSQELSYAECRVTVSTILLV